MYQIGLVKSWKSKSEVNEGSDFNLAQDQSCRKFQACGGSFGVYLIPVDF